MLSGLAVSILQVLAGQPVQAQQPEFFETPTAPGQWNYGRRLDESRLRYCVDRRDPDRQVAAEIADAIAAGLLLEPVRYVVPGEIVVEDITNVYSVMLEHCDMHMGFKLIPQGYGTWATLTRAYYEAQYVFVTDDPELQSLDELPAGSRIGATIGTTAHIRLIAYLKAMPAEQRWAAFPMGTNDLALASVLNGTVDVALVWSPSLWAVRDDEAYADLQVIDSAPLPATTLGVGALMLSDETFLRTAVDEAIAALIADGTIAAILESNGFPATAAP